jgi:proline iminopeptidase
MENVLLTKAIMKYKEGYLKVSKIHKIHYRLYGNPKKEMIIYNHGGPGGVGFDDYKDYIDLDKYCFLSYDQRGCGESIPFLETKDNSTKNLIDDIVKLQNKFKKKKTIFFSDSWGTTLSLLFAMKYPNKTKALILNGLFFGDSYDLNFLYYKKAKKYSDSFELIFDFPYQFTDYKDFLEYSYTKIDDINYLYSFGLWEMFLSLGFIPPIKSYEKIFYKSIAKMEIFYFKHKIFLRKELLNYKGLNKLINIPISVNHGLNDEVCSPNNPKRLKKLLPHIEINYYNGRHMTNNDKEIKKQFSFLNKINS